MASLALSTFVLAVFSTVLLSHSASGVCTNPSVSVDTYTSKSKALSTLTAYVAEFTLTCKEEGEEKMNLYAEVQQGVVVPVAVAGPESNNYQLSWTLEHSKAVQGSIPVKMFTEEGYAAYRKTQRSGGDVGTVEPFVTVTIEHPGVTSEVMFVNTEFVAVLCSLFVVWSANSMKSRIIA